MNWYALTRFVIGGAIVAGLPFLAKAFGPFTGGKIMLVPAIALLSFAVAGRTHGASSMAALAHGGIVGLIPLAAFLLTVSALAERTSIMACLGAALAVWAVTLTATEMVSPGTLSAMLIVAAAGLRARGFLAGYALLVFSLIGLIVSTAFGVLCWPLLGGMAFGLALVTMNVFEPMPTGNEPLRVVVAGIHR